jgi:type VII secretion-associated protein (TIGR03931 family)
VSTHMIEVGPKAIRQLCCGGTAVADDVMVRGAFDCIDDPVTLIDLRPVSVDSLWRMVLGSVHCERAQRAIIVHPSWWAQTRVDLVRAAAQIHASEVVMRPRSWLLTRDSPPGTVVVEIADDFVVVTGVEVVAETRRGETQRVVEAVVRSVIAMTPEAIATVVIDAPGPAVVAGKLPALIAKGLRASGMGTVHVVDDEQLKQFAAVVIQDEARVCEPPPDVRDHGGRWKPTLVALLIVAVLGMTGALASARRSAPAEGSIPMTVLVEGRVAVEIPARWPTQRVVTGPGSARVQVTSPSDPEMALHVTQSRVAIAALSATAEFLKQAIDAERTGSFVDFNPADNVAGRPAVTYREVRSGHDIRWSVLVDNEVRISIGCQSRRGHEHAMQQVCEDAVRSARALS